MSKYISLENLERYDAKMQEHFASFCASKQDGMWRQTEKAGAVSFWPVGNSPLEGTVEFMFKETGPASGTKSPDNPSTITGVSQAKVTRCGKNLCPHTILYNNQSGVTITANTDGSFTFNGTASGDLYAMLFNGPSSQSVFPEFLNKGSTYSLSLTGNDQNIKFRVSVAINNAWIGGVAAYVGSGQTAQITIPANATGCLLRFEAPAGTVFSDSVVKPQLELGTTATSFEPYAGANYIVNLGDTYFGGSVDLATGLITVTHEVRYISPNITFSSSSFREDSYRYGLYFTPTYAMKKTGTASSYVSNYFDVVYNNYLPEKSAIMVANSNYGMFLFLDKEEFSLNNGLTQAEVIEAMRPWFAGKEVRFYYPLATPRIIQISSFSPPQVRALIQPDKYVPRINTVYSDAENVQIVYQKNPVRDKFEKVQAIIAQGGNV